MEPTKSMLAGNDYDINLIGTQLLEQNDQNAYQEILKIKDYIENNFDEENYFHVVSCLFVYHKLHGDFFICKDLLQKAINVYESNNSKNNSYYIRQLYSCLGTVELLMKNVDAALNIYLSTQVMFIDAHDYGSSYYTLLFQIGEAYLNKNDYLSAKLYIDEGIEIYNKIYGDIFKSKDSGDLLILNLYGKLCLQINDLPQAEKCFKYVIKTMEDMDAKKQTGIYNNQAYFASINNLANIYLMQQKWTEAYNLIATLNCKSEFDQYILLQNKLICSLYLNYEKNCLQHLNDMNSVATDNVLNIFTTFSEIERDNYWSDVSWRQIIANNIVANNLNSNLVNGIAYDNTLFCRSLMNGFKMILDDKIETNQDFDLKNKYDEYKHLRERLTYKTTDAIERQNITLYLISLEHDLINSIPNLRELLQSIGGTWKDVQTNLGENDVAIEFTYVPDITPHKDVRYYAAFILRKEYDSPRLLVLCDSKKVDELLLCDDPDELFLDSLYNHKNMNTLYSMIWSSIDSVLKENENIYYSPIGSLIHLNFDLLRNETGHNLNERYNLIRVSSTSRIAEIKNNLSYYNSATLFGNLLYNESIADMATESAKYTSFSGKDIEGSLSLRSIDDRSRWGALSYTKKEIDSIGIILNNKGITTMSYEGAKGNEESFKALSGNSPDIIHLATHGFLIDTQQKAEGKKFIENTFAYSQREGYMTWCGLMMAGSNNAWTGNFNLENVEDGILTADEISRLDLSNTKLVVLSACETARGKIDPVEGVLGLQRAFKKAGAQTIVMSLWKVPDESTSILMTQFYKNLMTGIERHQALKDAMNYVKKLYPDPYYWAGFIMLD